jgi:hypothetical protein
MDELHAPLLTLWDQIQNDDLTRMPPICCSENTIAELDQNISELSHRSNPDKVNKQLRERYHAYLHGQDARIREAEPALTAMFRTGNALQKLEQGDPEPAERFLGDIIPYTSEHPPIETGFNVPVCSLTASSLRNPQQSCQEKFTTDGERSHSELASKFDQPSSCYQDRARSLAPGPAVLAYARSVLTEALRNSPYVDQGGNVAGRVTEVASLEDCPVVTEIGMNEI